MARELDTEDKGVLEYRPNIYFTEPEQQPGEIEGLNFLQTEDIEDARDRIKKLAQAINTLATAVQARVDQRADDMVIELDPDVDADAIHAMLRRFPGQDPRKITYRQYRECKNGILAKGEEIGKQALISPEQVQDARDRLGLGRNLYVPGGFDVDGLDNGSLRPELNKSAYILPPLNIDRVQVDLICILVNYIWKEYIKELLGKLPIVGAAAIALPDKICDAGFEGDAIPGLYLLGMEPDDLLSGKTAEDSVERVGKQLEETTQESLKSELIKNV